MKGIVIGGTFDNEGGKKSFFVHEIAKNLQFECINGGNMDDLKSFNPKEYNICLWMPNISNKEDKILPLLKKINPHMVLIQSKRVIEKQYSESDVVGRLLQSHSLLGIMIEKPDNCYNFKLLDPLGNLWCDTKNLEELCYNIKRRLNFFGTMNRVGSIKTKDIKPIFDIEQDFIDIIKEYGDTFSKFVAAVNPYRLLGNSSTRCSFGFPAKRVDNHIAVTRRNVDKQFLSSDDFVLCQDDIGKAVKYYGENKPSVDTPIQIKLFDYYKNVNYMIHGHSYIKGGIFTDNCIPCGYIEEFDEVIKLFLNVDSNNFCINLRGHGCLILAKDLGFLDNKKKDLYPRPAPEIQIQH